MTKYFHLLLMSAFILHSLTACDKTSLEDDPLYGSIIEIYSPDTITGERATLVAKIPLNSMESATFELSTNINMNELVDFKKGTPMIIPNSAEKQTLIYMPISGLKPQTEYYARIGVLLSDKEQAYSKVISFKTTESQTIRLKMPKAMIMGLNGMPQVVSPYYASLDLTAGTISGKPEQYGLYTWMDNNDPYLSNGTTPSINICESGTEGAFYAYGFVNTSTNADIINGTGLNKRDYTDKLYFRFNDTNCGTDIAVGKGCINDEEIWLKSTMACLELTVRNKPYGLYIRDIRKSSILFRAGWLNLATGCWERDEDKIQDIVSDGWLGYYMTIAYDERTSGLYHIYVPPIEFGDGDLCFAILRRQTEYDVDIPANKWEAGKKYSYQLNF